jgi:hypothetical protein
MPDVFFRRGYNPTGLKFRDGSTDGLREIAILEQVVCHKLPGASAGVGLANCGRKAHRRNWLMIQRIRLTNTLMTRQETSGK